MTPEWKALAERIKAMPPPTPEERLERELRFAYFNAHIENERITPELIVGVAEEMDGVPPGTYGWIVERIRASGPEPA